MDILLSLPIASYFFSASLTSWSTSLNLLFFYMTWTTLVLSHSPLKIELVGFLAIRIVFWLVPSLFFLLFDTSLPSLSETIKYNGCSALPPRDANSLARISGLALVNLSLETALQALISLSIGSFLQTPVFRTSSTLPLPWQIVKHVALLFLAREVLGYSIHRYILHDHASSRAGTLSKSKSKNKSWKGKISRLHKSHAHFRRAPPFSLLVKADHPIPYLLHRLVPVYLPAVLLSLYAYRSSSSKSIAGIASNIIPSTGAKTNESGVHILTFLLFMVLTTLEETLTTSGYTVIPGILLGGITRRTALHYSSRTSESASGNYGAWGILDWVGGTSLGKDVMEDLHDEAEKHHLREKGEKAADEAGSFLGEKVDGLRRSSRSRAGKTRS